MADDKIEIEVAVGGVTFYTYEEFTKQHAHLTGTSFVVISDLKMTAHYLLRSNAELQEMSGHEVTILQVQSLDKNWIKIAVCPDKTQISVLHAVTAEDIPLNEWIRSIESDQSIIHNQAVITNFAKAFNAEYARKFHGHPPLDGFRCIVSIPEPKLKSRQFLSDFSSKAQQPLLKDEPSLDASKISSRKWCCLY